jgi:hypothetical protein
MRADWLTSFKRLALTSLCSISLALIRRTLRCIKDFPLNMSDWKAHVGPQLLERLRVMDEVCNMQCIVIKLLETITIQHKDLASVQQVKISSVVQCLKDPDPEGGDLDTTIEVRIDHPYQPEEVRAIKAQSIL